MLFSSFFLVPPLNHSAADVQEKRFLIAFPERKTEHHKNRKKILAVNTPRKFFSEALRFTFHFVQLGRKIKKKLGN